MLKLRYIILTFILAFAGLFIRFFPMSNALAIANVDAVGGISLSQIEGNVWNGKARVVAPLNQAKVPAQKMKVQWSFNWLSLLTLQPSTHIVLSTKDKSQVAGDMRLSTKRLALSQMNGIIQASLLNKYVESYQVQLSKGITLKDVAVDINREKIIKVFSGEILWHAGETSFPNMNKTIEMKEMKPVKLLLSLEENTAKIVLTDTKGQLVLGKALVDPLQTAKLSVTPRLLAYQDLPYPAKAKMDQPIFEQEMMLNE